MFSTLLTMPRAPLSRIHSTNLIPSVELDCPVSAPISETKAGISASTAVSTSTRRTRRQPVGPTGPRRADDRRPTRGAGALGHDDVPGRVTVAFVAFCLLSSGIYAINDVRDVHEDRLHPKKRFRPVAAGELSRGAAGAIGAALMAVGLGLCVFISPVLG